MKRTATILFGLVMCALLAQGQGTFKNLDFEQANIVPFNGEINPSLIDASEALPYWTVYTGNKQDNYVVYDTYAVGSPAVSIHDYKSTLTPLQGSYSVGLQHSKGGNPKTASIGQTGILPKDINSIIFYAVNPDDIKVTFSGQEIPITWLGNYKNADIVGGDISNYAGQSGELPFTHLGAPILEISSIDNIYYSNDAIPESSNYIIILLFHIGYLLKKSLIKR
ncbi:MAG: hypothetical protein K9N48_01325 [Verrucomicrobia bacterium]|nr:hypothetical protein [Verrucomicrobiota bacterium]MCF7707293.1 hypothetical protein [Verrucomicrobiota bacterium]